ncbi:hypothetical protein, partial [Dongia sp.]|uniref:hypothetical protein n=1 Tax=Dongia sp. TaxID=1977262 RepID=UPI0034A386BA
TGLSAALKNVVAGHGCVGSRRDPPTFERLHDRRHRSGRKTLVQWTKSGDIAVKRQATWGMSAHTKNLNK